MQMQCLNPVKQRERGRENHLIKMIIMKHKIHILCLYANAMSQSCKKEREGEKII